MCKKEKTGCYFKNRYPGLRDGTAPMKIFNNYTKNRFGDILVLMDVLGGFTPATEALPSAISLIKV